MPRIELDGKMHELADCPDCGRTVTKEKTAFVGFIARCGRRLINLSECKQDGCSHRREE